MITNISNLQTQADKILLQQFSPAAVLIDVEGNIKYVNGRTGKYLDIPADRANWNIHVMAHKELQHHIIVAINEAQKQVTPINIPNLTLGTHTNNLTVQAISVPKPCLAYL